MNMSGMLPAGFTYIFLKVQTKKLREKLLLFANADLMGGICWEWEMKINIYNFLTE
jgi:hypothetical protein